MDKSKKFMFFSFQNIKNGQAGHTYSIIEMFKNIIDKDIKHTIAPKRELFFPRGDICFTPKGEEYQFSTIHGKIGFQTKKDITIEAYDETTGTVQPQKIINETPFGFFSDFAYRDDLKLFAVSQSRGNAIKSEYILQYINHAIENYFGRNTLLLKLHKEKELNDILEKEISIKEYICRLNEMNPINPENVGNIKEEFKTSKASKIELKYISKEFNLVFNKIINESLDYIDLGYGNYKFTYKDKEGNENIVNSKDNILKIAINCKSNKVDIDDFIKKTNIFANKQKMTVMPQ